MDIVGISEGVIENGGAPEKDEALEGREGCDSVSSTIVPEAAVSTVTSGVVMYKDGSGELVRASSSYFFVSLNI